MMQRRFPRFSALLLPLVLAAAAFLSSCMVTDGPYYGGGGGGGGGGSLYRESYVDEDDYSPGYSYGGGYGGGGVVYTNSYYYGGRYYDYCPYCHHHPCTCHSRHSDVRIVRRESHNHDHDRDHRSSSNSKDNDIKLVRYRQGGSKGDLPSGYHDPQWFKNRGISLKQNTFKDRDGDNRGRSSSHDNNRHDNDKKDDDHKKGKKH